MASQVDIYNLALTNLDISQTVKSVNDNSNAAGTLNTYWDLARQKVLEAAHWQFATRAVAMTLLLDQATLTATSQVKFPGWRYIYQRPQDALRILAVTTMFGLRTNPLAYYWRDPTQPTQWGPFRPPWREMLDQVGNPAGQAVDILTDQDAAWAVYVVDVPNVNLWTMAFREAVAWQLGAYAAGPLSANQAAKQNAIKMAALSITSALQINLNEQQPDPYPESPAITARN